MNVGAPWAHAAPFRRGLGCACAYMHACRQTDRQTDVLSLAAPLRLVLVSASASLRVTPPHHHTHTHTRRCELSLPVRRVRVAFRRCGLHGCLSLCPAATVPTATSAQPACLQRTRLVCVVCARACAHVINVCAPGVCLGSCGAYACLNWAHATTVSAPSAQALTHRRHRRSAAATIRGLSVT